MNVFSAMFLTISLAAAMQAQASESLSYRCGQSVGALAAADFNPGPMFLEGSLIFTSIEAKDSSRLLIVNAGAGTYVLRLSKAGLNRIRFSVPVGPSGISHEFFMSYLHGGSLPSRYFEFSEGHPSVGHDRLDYERVAAQPAENLRAHLNYAIQKTAQALIAAARSGRISRRRLIEKPLACFFASEDHKLTALAAFNGVAPAGPK